MHESITSLETRYLDKIFRRVCQLSHRGLTWPDGVPLEYCLEEDLTVSEEDETAKNFQPWLYIPLTNATKKERQYRKGTILGSYESAWIPPYGTVKVIICFHRL